MRQLYYTIQTLLRGRGSNVVKTVSLTLGLFVGILLFSQIAYEFSYENFYQDPERLVMLRMRNTKDGIPEKGTITVLIVLRLPTCGRQCPSRWNVPV